MEFFNFQFLIGLIIGGLITLALYPMIKKKNDTEADNFHEKMGAFKESISNIEQAIKLHEYTVIMAYKDSLIGYGHLDRDCYHTWLGICIADIWTGLGAGDILMESLTSKFPKRRISLTVDVENEAAINLYKKYGFETMKNVTKDVILILKL